MCSGDRKNLKNEMSKILNYCFEKKSITRQEILKLINLYEDENYFELIDSCLSKNFKQISKIINNNNFSKNRFDLILIRSFLSRLKRLIELKKLQNELGNVNQTIEKTLDRQYFGKIKKLFIDRSKIGQLRRFMIY